MDTSKARRIWGILKAVFGTLLVATQAGLVFLLADPPLGRALAITLVVVGVVVVPLALTVLVQRGLRKVDSNATLLKNLPGMMAVCAILTLAALAIFARGAVSERLIDAKRRYPSAGFAGSIVAWTGRLVAPAPEPEGGATEATDAGVSPAPERDAGTAMPRKTGRRDAGARGKDAATGAIARAPDAGRPDAGGAARVDVDAGTRGEVDPAPRLAGTVQVCDRVRSVWPADLGHEPAQELVVGCSESVHAIWLRPGGEVLERTKFSIAAPAGLELSLRDPRVADLDADGRQDVLLCAHWTTERGGTRGGDTWWAPGLENGQFARPIRLVGGFCGAIETGDVDGDGQAELLVAHVGNPWQEARPNGELRWFERAGRRWRPGGRTPLSRNPSSMWLADANGDSTLDAIVRHDWSQSGIGVCLGSARGPLAMDPFVTAPSEPNRRDVVASLDQDDRPDRVRAVDGALEIHLSSPPAGGLRELTRALDYEELTP